MKRSEINQALKEPEAMCAEYRFACAAAGLSTTRPGGISSVPEYAEVSATMPK